MSKVTYTKATLPAGGGAFKLAHTAVGIFLDAQPSHHLAVAGDKRLHAPLDRLDGWIMQAGSEGVCEFDDALDLVMLEIPDALLTEVGGDPRAGFAPRVGTLDPMLIQMALGADKFLEGEPIYAETMQRALAAHLFQAEISHSQTSALDISDIRLRRVVDHVQDRLDQKLSLEDMAGLAGMSPYHFARAFKSATGAAPLKFIIAARMDRAKLLLRTTRRSVAEIAYAVGYEDLSRFGQHFKRHTGATPRAFREAG
ncbi:helix-turn-helix domain-containing protein [Tropicimonas sp. S265A]|uniref:helix-turn-helix domain-containing protein n=1 Tax=Tropicimonas sp. S265A TaxID=3415134 RepID=UPI003C7C62AE